MNSSYLTRRHYASESLDFNLKNPLFKELFKKKVAELRKKSLNSKEVNRKRQEEERGLMQTDFSEKLRLYGLYCLLVVIVVGWILVKQI